MKQETKCLHSGYVPKNGEPRQMPIYQSTTFKYDSSDAMGRLFDLEDSGYFYTRLQNPSNDMTAAKIADLEGGVAAMLTSSGQAANFFALFNICETGSHIVASSAIYGGTYNLLGVTMKKMGIDVTFVDQNLPEEELAKAFRPNTRAMFGETITNPTVSVLDIEKFARLAHTHTVFRLLLTTLLQLLSTVSRLSGVLTLLLTQPQNIWTVTVFLSAVQLLTAATLTGSNMPTNIRDLQLPMIHITALSMPKNSASSATLQRLLLSLCVTSVQSSHRRMLFML